MKKRISNVYRNKKYKAKLRIAWYYLKNLDPRHYFDNVSYNEKNEQQSRFLLLENSHQIST
jgi:hypothetical protein